jgi:AcrR family transcriptional regulator
MSTPSTGLRERKKARTRRAIRMEALRLFDEQGYESTTIEQIAAAAEVSPSTFFRYFPTKEDLVLQDDYDPLMLAALRDRPVGESVVASLQAAVVEPLRDIWENDREELLLRLRLLHDVPAIRAQMHVGMGATSQVLVDWLAERSGRPEDEFRHRVTVSAVMGAWTEIIMYWAERGGQDDLPELFEESLTALAEAFGRPPARPDSRRAGRS